MSNGAIETIFLSNKVTKGKISQQVFIQKFQKGIWQVAIDSVSIQQLNLENLVETICCLKCNWITNTKLNENNELYSQSPVIFQWLVSKQLDCFHNSNLTWFDINSLSQNLIIDVENLLTNMLIDFECKLNVIFLLKQKI